MNVGLRLVILYPNFDISNYCIDLLKVHLFYITQHNIVNEVCWSAKSGWNVGSLTTKAPAVSAYSSLSATCSNDTITMYCQRKLLFFQNPTEIPSNQLSSGNTMICEFSYTIFPPKWWYRELSEGLRGTYIASTSYAATKSTMYHVYFQDEGNFLQENIYERQ
jgi:hypothetical protein